MAERRPLVVVSGVVKELPSGDTLPGSGGGGGTPTLVHVTTTTHTATPGQHCSMENAAATTITLPASPLDGDVVWVTVNNGRTDNVLARNGTQIMGLSENMTLDVVMTYQLRFINTSWRLL